MKWSLIALMVVTPLVALVAAIGIQPSDAKIALGWNLSAQCGDHQNVTGDIDIPSSESGKTFNVFVDDQDAQGWHWVTNAGQDIHGTGSQHFDMNVSKTPSDAKHLRVRYKEKLDDPNAGYGPETSAWFAPCFPPTPPLHVFDLQGECIRPSIVGGMIGIPDDMRGRLPFTVFVEYQDPGTTVPEYEDWHWVRNAGKEINHTGLVNYEMNISEAPANAVALRIRYKDKDWVYGPEIAPLSKSGCTAATPTNTPVTPTNTSVPPTKTSTSVPPASTSTPVPPKYVPPTNTPVPPPVTTCTPICPPNTGSGGYLEGQEHNWMSTRTVIGFMIVAGLMLVALGGMSAVALKEVRKN